MAIKYKKIGAVTKRWAAPIAIVLLPGGFVLLALGWMYKIWQIEKPVAPVEAAEVAERAPAGAVGRMLATATLKVRRAHAVLAADLTTRRPRGRPADQPQEHVTSL